MTLVSIIDILPCDGMNNELKQKQHNKKGLASSNTSELLSEIYSYALAYHHKPLEHKLHCMVIRR